MKKKRIIAGIMCAIMMLTQIQTIPVRAEEDSSVVSEEKVQTVYVSAAGSDEKSGDTKENAYATVRKAIDSLNWWVTNQGYTSGVIKVVGEVELTDDNGGLSNTHSANIVIEGEDEEAKLKLSGGLTANGPFTFGDITLNYTKNGQYIVANGNEIVFSENVKTTGTGEYYQYQPNFTLGSYAGAAGKTQYKATVSGGSHYNFFLADSVIADSAIHEVPGVDFVMNGGTIWNLVLGGNGWEGQNGTNKYTGNVNLTFNGGSVGNSLQLPNSTDAGFSGKTDFNGRAVQIIMNNGVDIKMNTGFTADKVKEFGGSLYVLKAAAETGCSLETTEIAGTYKVNGEKVAVATSEADSTKKVYSEDGTLTVDPGTYRVSWEEKKEVIDTVYVSASGNDTNDGKSVDAPFATLVKAISTLEEHSTGTATIKVIGEFDLKSTDFSAAHSKKIVIEGNDSEAKLNIGERVSANGPFTFGNITLNYTQNGQYIVANGNEIVFSENVKTTGTGEYYQYQPNFTLGSYARAAGKTQYKATVSGGSHYNFFLADSVIADSAIHEVPGVDFVMNGGTIWNLVLGGNGWEGQNGTNKYTGNVNLTFNGGSVGNSLQLPNSTDAGFSGKTDFNGQAVQIIMNNGVDIKMNTGFTADKVEEFDGSLYILKADKEDGCSLETTETAGTYTVNGGMIAVATDENGNEYQSSGTTLKIEKPGTYTVTWKDPNATGDVYVSENGSDETGKGTMAAPFKTITKAIQKLKITEEENKTVYLLGKYTLENSLESHKSVITIKGTEGAVLHMTATTGCCQINGPIVLSDVTVKVDAPNQGFWTKDNELTIGENVTCKTTYGMDILMTPTDNTSGSVGKTELSNGKYRIITIGGRRNSGSEKEIAGAELIVNGGSVQEIDVFTDSWDTSGHKGTKYTGDVNLTFNGGSVGTVSLTSDKFPSTYEKAVQIVINHGGYVNAITGSDVVNNKNYWLMKGAEGGSLTVTETAGTFKVSEGVTAVAYGTDGSVVVSKDESLTVPAGEYTVEFSKDLVYTNNGTEIKFVKEGPIDFEAVKHEEKAGKLFIGWKNGDTAAASGTFAEGTVLEAQYADFDKEKDFMTNDIQLKNQSENKQALRFRMVLRSAFQSELQDTGVKSVKFGGLCIPLQDLDGGTAILGNYNPETTFELTLSTNGIQTKELSVTDCTYSNAAMNIEDISAADYSKMYAAKGYIQYTDLNGCTQNFYTEEVTGSVISAANALLEKEDISEQSKSYLENLKELAKASCTENVTPTGKYETWGCFENNGATLANTYKKLTEDKKLTVAYFGGSLTNGYGCGQTGDPNGTDGISNENSSWRALTGKWFQDNFPDADITNVDAAIGESGTYLGVYRTQEDIIPQKPDLLFIEYAINDDYFAQSNHTMTGVFDTQPKLQLETIIREVRTALPECDIVIVLTTDKDKIANTYQGTLFSTAQAHADIAKAYGLPVVNLGLGLAKGIAEAEHNTAWWNDANLWKKYIYDNVHPYSTGHYYYYLCMKEFLFNNLISADLSNATVTKHTMPAVQSANLLDGDRKNIYGKDMQNYCTSTDATYKEDTFSFATSQTERKGYYEVLEEGEIEFKFTGTEFTIWSNVKKDFQYTVDDGEFTRVAGSSHAPTIIVSGLTSGEHTVVIKAGTETMKIGALFTRDASKETKQGTGATSGEAKNLTNAAGTAQAVSVLTDTSKSPYSAFYKLSNGLSVREVNIDTGSGEDAELVEIVQLTDFHYNYYNEQDRQEANPSTYSTVTNRGLNPNGTSAKNSVKCMEYASMFDQTVITGDVMDYMSYGGFELMDKLIWNPFPETIALLGNHDNVRVFGLPTDFTDPTTTASRYEVMSANWKHDVYYTSKVVENKVMVIQMDNGQNKFWDSQVEKFSKDLETAREKGYTVLLFVHVPLSTGNSADTAVMPTYATDPDVAKQISEGTFTGVDFYRKHAVGLEASGATKEIYDLVTLNADVIKGVFTGHHHSDFYTEINAKTNDGADTTIPQYTLGGSCFDEGHALKINVK